MPIQTILFVLKHTPLEPSCLPPAPLPVYSPGLSFLLDLPPVKLPVRVPPTLLLHNQCVTWLRTDRKGTCINTYTCQCVHDHVDTNIYSRTCYHRVLGLVSRVFLSTPASSLLPPFFISPSSLSLSPIGVLRKEVFRVGDPRIRDKINTYGHTDL